MAKIRFGEIVADARGSIDGITYSRNRFGAYARNRVSPVNPNTPAQQAVRTTLTSYAQAWRALTEENRLGWSTLGSQIIRTNSLGNTYTLTGLQAFIEVNSIRDILGLGQLSEAPALDQAPEINTATLVLDVSALVRVELTFTALGGLATNEFFVFATDGVSAGRNFFRPSQYRFIGSFLGNAASPVDLTSAYETKWGSMVVGEKASFLLVGVSANRLKGGQFRVDAIVQA